MTNNDNIIADLLKTSYIQGKLQGRIEGLREATVIARKCSNGWGPLSGPETANHIIESLEDYVNKLEEQR